MKYLLIICLLLPCSLLAQTQADYENALTRFVKFYNHQQGDSIIRMWPADINYGDALASMWGKEQLNSLHKKYGKLTSYEYIGIDTEDPNPGLAVFKTKFAKAGWKTTSLTLDSTNHLSTFRFSTESDGIDKLLKANK